MRIKNNISKMIVICEELVWRESGYSYLPLKVDLSNRFWKESWIDIIVTSLHERELTVINNKFEKKRVTGNRIIIDFVVDYLDQHKIYKKQRIK